MPPRNSMRTKTWSFERMTLTPKFGQNGGGAKGRARRQAPDEPQTKTIWKLESTKGIVYGFFYFTKPICYFI